MQSSIFQITNSKFEGFLPFNFWTEISLGQFDQAFSAFLNWVKVITVKLGFKELFGHHKKVP